jgi:hypothetical protein
MLKSALRLLAALAVLVALGACNLLSTPGGGGSQTISGPPVVRIVAPLPNAAFYENVPVNIVAQVSNAGPDISRVEVLVDGAIAATVQTPNTAGAPTFSVTQSWKSSGVGQHTIALTAFRADGSSSAPASVNVSVMSQQAQASPTNTQTSGQSGTTGGNQQTGGSQQNNQPSGGNNAQAAPTNPPPTNPPAPTTPPTAAPTATPDKPQATFNTGVNVRAGPSTKFNPPIGSFAANSTADIVGKNPAGDWYKVSYYNGAGWVLASLMTVTGDQSKIPVDQGPPIPTDTPTPVPFTPTPATSINLVAGNVGLSSSPPKCNQTINVTMDVANFGTTASPGGTVLIQDILVSDGSVQQQTTGAFGPIQPGQTVNTGNIPFTISTHYAEQHRIIAIVNPNGEIPETTRDDNRKELPAYTLEKATC